MVALASAVAVVVAEAETIKTQKVNHWTKNLAIKVDCWPVASILFGNWPDIGQC